jgi:hypothetical protein
MTESPELWVSPWWQAVLLPRLWDVGGVSVNPLTNWHLLALEQLGNAYILQKPPDRDDATAMLLFASGDMEYGRKLMTAPHFRNRSMLKMYRRIKNVEWMYLHRACSEYVNSCTRHIGRYRKQGAVGAVVAAPEPWHVVRVLCSEWGFNVNDAWNHPYLESRCMFDTSAEAKGDNSLMSEAAQRMEDNWEVVGKE